MLQPKQVWKLLAILALILVCIARVVRFNPSLPLRDQFRLKPGLDLVGGTVLTYEVNVGNTSNPKDVLDQTINILQARVDPAGVMGLTWRQAGEDRIEIEMPGAKGNVDELRTKYLKARQDLLALNVAPHRRELDAALKITDEAARDAALQKVAAGSQERLELFRAYAAAAGARESAEKPYQAVQDSYRKSAAELKALPATAPKAQREPLEADLKQKTAAYVKAIAAYGKVQEAFDKAGNDLFTTDVNEDELNRILDKPPGAGREADLEAFEKAHRLQEKLIAGVGATYAEYEKQKGPFDDPNDLIQRLRGAGVLEFRIAPSPEPVGASAEEYIDRLEKLGPNAGTEKPYRWFIVDDPQHFAGRGTAEEVQARLKNMMTNPRQYFASGGGGQPMVGAAYNGKIYLLLGNTSADSMTKARGDWKLTNVTTGRDHDGGAAVDFSLNSYGSSLMGDLTGAHIGQPMSIVLDDRVISTPTIQGRLDAGVQITGGTGGFSPREQDYLVRTLNAGSLQARLTDYPISIRKIGSQYGEENLRAGLNAAIWAFICVGGFMLCYYWFWGLVANFALVANLLIVLAIMSGLLDATFTLPGIAGFVLTIGMAVDANVLIYERVREEMERKNPLKTAIRLGNEKALATIIDAHVTAIATCVILGMLATADIRGFAITLGIGLVANVFTAVVCSRIIADAFVDWFNPKALPMLPMKVGFVHRFLSPKIDWIGTRHIFWGISGVLSIAGIIGIAVRGIDFFDIEFRGGTEVTFEVGKQVADGLTGEEVGQRLDKAAAEANLPDLRHDRVTIITIGKTEDKGGHVYAREFKVSTLIQDPGGRGETNDVIRAQDAIKSAFRDVLDKSLMQRISFQGAAPKGDNDIPSVFHAPVYALTTDNLQADINTPVTDATGSGKVPAEFLGGVAIVLRDLDPATSPDEVQSRIDRMRLQTNRASAASMNFQVEPLEWADKPGGLCKSVVVLARNSGTSPDHPATTTEAGGLADDAWRLVHNALTRDSSLGSVTSFSSQVSGTMTRNAIVAVVVSWFVILAYVWFRFGNVRYGLGAVIAMIHDVVVAVGLAALAKFFCEGSLAPVGRALLLEPFRVNLAFIASVLTLIGYSVNDTIVVFDRIRENRGKLAFASPQIINDSINQTISRTVLTAFTVFISVTLLYILGGESIRGFAFVMLIGTIVGCYSSIAVASPLLLVGLRSKLAPAPAPGMPAGAASGRTPPAKPAGGGPVPATR